MLPQTTVDARATSAANSWMDRSVKTGMAPAVAGHDLEQVSFPLGAGHDDRPAAVQQLVSHLPEPRRRIATGLGAGAGMKECQRLVWADPDVPEAPRHLLPAGVWNRNLQRGVDVREAKSADEAEIAVDLMGFVRCAAQLGGERAAPELLRFPGA